MAGLEFPIGKFLAAVNRVAVSIVGLDFEEVF